MMDYFKTGKKYWLKLMKRSIYKVNFDLKPLVSMETVKRRFYQVFQRNYHKIQKFTSIGTVQ